jgi:hypothetical protein
MASSNEANSIPTRRVYKKSVKRRGPSATARKKDAKRKTPRTTGYRVILDPANPPTHDVLTPENIRAAIRAILGK